MRASLYKWLKRGAGRRAVIIAFTKPLARRNIEKRVRTINYVNNSYNVRLKELEQNNIIECINPEDGRKKVYRLTKRGERFARKFAAEQGREFIYNDKEVDWNLYGWVISCPRREKIFIEITEEGKRLRDISIDAPRGYKHDVLSLLARKKLIRRKKVGWKVYYILTKKGREIKSLILKP